MIVGDFVASCGPITIMQMNRPRRVEITASCPARVSRVDDDRVHVQPGRFDGVGRFCARREAWVCDPADLEVVPAPARGV